MPINRGTDQEDVIHTQNGVLLNHKRVPFARTWMDPEAVILSELRERQIAYDIAYMWNLKKGYQ